MSTEHRKQLLDAVALARSGQRPAWQVKFYKRAGKLMVGVLDQVNGKWVVVSGYDALSESEKAQLKPKKAAGKKYTKAEVTRAAKLKLPESPRGRKKKALPSPVLPAPRFQSAVFGAQLPTATMATTRRMTLPPPRAPTRPTRPVPPPPRTMSTGFMLPPPRVKPAPVVVSQLPTPRRPIPQNIVELLPPPRRIPLRKKKSVTFREQAVLILAAKGKVSKVRRMSPHPSAGKVVVMDVQPGKRATATRSFVAPRPAPAKVYPAVPFRGAISRMNKVKSMKP